ncbi:glycoside hydrolase family 26 protein, partial [Actinotalea sp. C106]|uniref:glycoside hydrolase family 26 protein n=1 Tax=Actinotalea sp. C106 TaxID=2908644 RepID=UPI00202794C9
PTAEPTTEPAPSPTPSTPPPAPAPVTEPAPEPPATPERRTVPIGATIPWGPLDTTALANRTAGWGTAPSYLLWYTGFGEPADPAKLAAVRAAGAVPVITWEPWNYTRGPVQPEYAMDRVVAGDHDTYITEFARTLAADGGPVHLRFAHEMNGTWYPWAAGVNGNDAADYVAAWKHVHRVFAEQGATNVTWVWSPNVVFPDSTPLANLYPGDAFVDVVGVDGYNWGTSQSWSSWYTGSEIFAPTLDEVRALAPGKPILITETASTELGGDKATWITELFAYLAAQPDVVGLVWFDENKETDWRVDSSSTSAAAFRDGAAD